MKTLILWISDHFSLIAWPTVVIMAWKLSATLRGYKDRFEKAEETIETIATNHLPHMQIELEKLNSSTSGGFDRVVDGLDNIRDIFLILNKKN